MTPLLILFFGVQPVTAVGTDLLFAAVTKSAGSVMHGLTRSIDWPVVSLLAAGSIPASVTTLVALSQLGLHGATASTLITRVLGYALFGTAAVLLLPNPILTRYAARIGTFDARRTAAITIMIGAALGCLVTISSVGAGAMGVAVLILLYPQLPLARLVGSDIAHAVPLTLLAGIGYWLVGLVDWQLLASLMIGSLPGVVLGSYAAKRVPAVGLRFVLAAALVFAASKLVL